MSKKEYKTVKELASELNVTRQTVYNKINEIKEETPKDEHYKYVNMESNRLTITIQGQDEIRNRLGIMEKQEDKPLLEIIGTLQEQLKIKDEQLKAKDEQILKLMDTIQGQQESITTQQKALREQGYIESKELELKALEAERNTHDGILRRIWKAIKNE